MVFDSLFPVFALIALGFLLRRLDFTTDAFLKVSDRLVYFIFFPAMLFWKIGAAPAGLFGESRLYLAVILAVLAVYGLSTTFIICGRIRPYQAGSFSQSCYRFNTYIGVAVMMSAFGEEGVRRFGILIAVIIPVVNVLAVSTLTWFGGEQVSPGRRALQTVRVLITNPLVLGCAGGIMYGQLVNRFPIFLDNTLKLASYVTLPLALLSIGGAITLAGLQTHLRLSLAASAFKLVVLPAAGYLLLKALGVSGLGFRIGMVFFALPTSTALYVLSSQLNSDTELASAAIALSTILSFFSLSAALLL
jgi:malonate transporter and related proteins